MTEWRDHARPDRPNFGLGDLSEGDEMTVTFLDEGHLKDTRHGKTLEIGVRVEDAPEGYEDMSDNPVQEGDDYNIMSSSSRFMAALDDFAETLNGATGTISAEGSGFERTYYIE